MSLKEITEGLQEENINYQLAIPMYNNLENVGVILVEKTNGKIKIEPNGCAVRFYFEYYRRNDACNVCSKHNCSIHLSSGNQKRFERILGNSSFSIC